jgi:hypothetical protein
MTDFENKFWQELLTRVLTIMRLLEQGFSLEKCLLETVFGLQWRCVL